jgi:transposase
MDADRARAALSRHAPVAKAMDYMLNRWDGFARFLGDGRVCLSNNAAERALRGIAPRRSLCPPSSSVWKDCELAFRNGMTRTSPASDRPRHLLGFKIDGPDLVWRAGNHLFGGEDALLDQAADHVVGASRNAAC